VIPLLKFLKKRRQDLLLIYICQLQLIPLEQEQLAQEQERDMRNQPRQAHRNPNPPSDCSLSAEEANLEKEEARKGE
jgi:hypothetical protein